MKTICNLIIISLLILVSVNFATSQIVVEIPIRPKVMVERPYCPGPRHVWIEGHWKWNKHRRQYEWREGHWARGQKNHDWEEGRWERVQVGWNYVPGRWTARRH